MTQLIGLSRRHLIAGAAGLSLGVFPTWTRAADLQPTPRQTAGPYYPSHLDLGALDNDLTRAPGVTDPVQGTLLDLFGVVRDPAGQPVPDAGVLIWQADAVGRYNHPADTDGAARDPNFEGAGVARTDGSGRYRFRTVKPAAYPPGGTWQRTPHIHMAVQTPAGASLVTQMYFPGEPLNAKDGLFRRLGDAARAAIARIEGAENGIERIGFDIVLA